MEKSKMGVKWVGFGRTELSLRRIAPASWCSIEWTRSRGLNPSKNQIEKRCRFEF